MQQQEWCVHIEILHSSIVAFFVPFVLCSVMILFPRYGRRYILVRFCCRFVVRIRIAALLSVHLRNLGYYRRFLWCNSNWQYRPGSKQEYYWVCLFRIHWAYLVNVQVFGHDQVKALSQSKQEKGGLHRLVRPNRFDPVENFTRHYVSNKWWNKPAKLFEVNRYNLLTIM